MSQPVQSQYEFDSEQNRIISQLARSMRIVAFPLLLLGILYAITFVVAVLGAFRDPRSIGAAVALGLAMLFFLCIGGWLRKAARGFHDVATTEGRDIAHLMEALENLRKMYSLLAAIVILYAALVLIALVVPLFWSLAK